MKSLLLNEVRQAVHGEWKTEFHKGLVNGVSTDSRQIKQDDLFIALRGQKHDGHKFIGDAIAAGAKGVIVDRNMPLTEQMQAQDICVIQVPDTLVALGQLARFYRKVLGHGVTVIAVTGSNGKTTTKEMIYHVLSKHRNGWRSPGNFNNAVGVPLSVFGIDPDHDFAVLELGTNAPGEIAALSRIAQPDIAVVTSVSAAHLEGLRNLDGVCAEKASIVTGLRERGVIVCSNEYQPLVDKLRPTGHTLIRFGIDQNAEISASELEARDGTVRFRTNDRAEVRLPMIGQHNVHNALAALAVSRRLGISSDAFADAIADFPGIPRRMSVHDVNGITIIDDAYNANPAGMAAAIEELVRRSGARRRVFACGDMLELGADAEYYHRELGRLIARSNIDLLFATGELSAITAQAAIENGMGVGAVQKSINSRRLARLIKSSIRDEDVILVKGSFSMQMDLVVGSLKRYRGNRPILRTHIRETVMTDKTRRSSARSSRT